MKKRVLLGEDAEAFVKSYAPLPKSKLVKKLTDAEGFSKKIGYPVVLKIVSKDAVHKTEIGGIKIAYHKEELQPLFEKLQKKAKQKKVKLDGILIQEHVKGQEVIIGLKKDPTFGPVIMFGTGGIFVELLKDVAFRVCPITEQDADDMIQELEMKKLLLGFRKQKPVNLPILRKTLVKLSKLAMKKDIEELDINPFIINDKEGKAVDVRVLI